MKQVYLSSIQLVTLFLIIGSPILSHAQLSAIDIIKKSDEMFRGKSSKSEMVMKIQRTDWTREITMKSWSLGDEFSLVLITAPARDKGSAFLNRNKELWNWQPRIDRVVKMPPSMMMQSWMGSDFTNDDLVKQSSIVKDYTHKLDGDSTIGNRECYKLILVPKPDAPVVWGKIIAFISKKEFLQLKLSFYDEEGFLVNTMNMSEVKNMNGRPFPTVMEMIPADNPKQKTMIVYRSITFDEDIPESFFSIQNMKKVR